MAAGVLAVAVTSILLHERSLWIEVRLPPRQFGHDTDPKEGRPHIVPEAGPYGEPSPGHLRRLVGWSFTRTLQAEGGGDVRESDESCLRGRRLLTQTTNFCQDGGSVGPLRNERP